MQYPDETQPGRVTQESEPVGGELKYGVGYQGHPASLHSIRCLIKQLLAVLGGAVSPGNGGLGDHS